MLNRFGVNSWATEWDTFTKRQLYRVGVIVAPYALARAAGYDFPVENNEPYEPALAPAVLGAAAAVAALAALAFVRRWRLLAATAVLFGFCWGILMRYNTYVVSHFFEGLWYMGTAMTLFAPALVGARRLLGARLGGRIAIAAAALAATIFALSVFHAGKIGRDADEAERHKTALADFSAIMEIARGERVQVVWHPDLWFVHRLWNVPEAGWRFWMRYWLSGSYFRAASDCLSAGGADFVATRYRDESLDLLTTGNRFVFLYGAVDALELCRAERRRLESSEPAARGVFDVYLQDSAISWLKAPCEPRDYEAQFYAYAHPIDPNDLPERHRQDGFHPTGGAIEFADLGAAFDDACLMTARLPDYPIAAIQTGQRIPGVANLWEAVITPPLDGEARTLYESLWQSIASSGEPAARAGFDLYLDDERGTLSYLKAPCDEEDTRGRFFLSVHPADAADLPADRRAIGHESLNFTFAPPAGAIFGGKCMAIRRLPDYAIERIETGQWIPGGDELWEAAIVVGD